MSSFDPFAAAIDWLDAYRAASPAMVDMYAVDAAVECGCRGATALYGHAAITEYWRQRFEEKPAGELTDLQIDGDGIVVRYRVPDGIVQAILHFDREGKIRRSQCGPTNAQIVSLRQS